MITLENVSKMYGDIPAVTNVSFAIPKGEIVGLLGHNGAGKTTIMKMLTGYLEPTEGTIRLKDMDVIAERIAVQRLIGYMPENAPLYREMTVQDYLVMMARLRGIAEDALGEAIAAAVKATGLEAWMSRPIGTLSKGYRQRVGICQAILHKPEVLILDEPTNGLDPEQIVEIRHLIRALAKTSTVILSTHILSEIEAVCDRVIIMVNGALAEDAALNDFLLSNQIIISIPASVSLSAVEALAGDGGVDGVTSVESLGADPVRGNYARYALTWRGDVPPVPEVLAHGTAQGWTFGMAADMPKGLESAFSRLMNASRDDSATAQAADTAQAQDPATAAEEDAP